MGGGSEYLLRCRPGTRFSIRRSGELYGSPAVVNVEVRDDDTVVVMDAHAMIAEQVAAAAW
jgi:hypothetical protein